MGRDDGSGARKTPWRCFNPRARVGRDAAGTLPCPAQSGFNPRARVGRDLIFDELHTYPDSFQSTRPRGARRLRHAPEAVGEVSIHAPAWGATPASRRLRSRCCRFNPRARVGRDLRAYGNGPQVTLFQSTRPRGARLDPDHVSSNRQKFQSTRPRGARLSTSYTGLQSFVVSIHAPAWGATPCPPGTPRCP